MKKVLKWILGLVATLVILLVAISVALPLLLDPNDYKDEISAAVEKRTGRELAINGDISWRIFPSIGLQINNVSLANRAGFGARPMIEVAEAAVIVKLEPLFSRRLEVGRVDLEGVSAYLRSNTDGRNNWEDLTGRGHGGTTGNTGQETTADLEIEVSQGNLSLSNTMRRVDLAGFDAGAQAGFDHQAFDLQGELTLTFLQQEITGELGYQGLLQLVRGQGLFGLQDLELSFLSNQSTTKESVSATTDVVLDMARDQARLTDFVLQFFDLRAEGEIDVASLSGEPEYSGRLTVAEFNPRQLMVDLGQEAPQTSKPSALSRLQAEMKFSGSPDKLTLSEIGIVLDDSTLTGQLTIQEFDPLRLVFDIGIDTLNLDDYSLLAAADEAADDDVKVEGTGLFVGSMLLFTGGGNLVIDHLVASGLTIEDLNAGITSNAQEMRLFPVSSRLYGGQQQGDVRVSFDADRTVLTTNQVVTGFEVSGLLQDLAGSARVHGTGDLYLKVRTVLGDTQQTWQSLTGDAGLSIVDGVIDDIDIRSAMDKVTAFLDQSGYAGVAIEAGDRMEFSELIVSGIIERGILKSDDLALRSTLVNASGQGTVNLVNDTVNYVIYTVPANRLAAQLPADYRSIMIPVRISGKLYEPDVSMDVAAGIMAPENANIVNQAARTLLEGLLDKKKDRQKKQ